MSHKMFSSEVEIGKFLGSLNIIPYAYQAISKTSLTYEVHTSPSGIQVLAFHCPPDNYTTRFLKSEFDLVSSQDFEGVDFISTKVNPLFSINRAAVELFALLSDDLKEIEKKHIYNPLIITGSGLGGYLAILSALRLQRAVDVEEANGAKKTKRPICITFGSPLIGDVNLQKAFLERPLWKSSFLNVVAKMDRVASLFSSSSSYKPFGTFLFCTEDAGHSAFEDDEAILAVLHAMASSNVGKMEKSSKYENVVNSIRRNMLYCRDSEMGESRLNPLKAGILLQFKEVGVLNDISNDVIEKIERKQTNMIKKKKYAYEPTKKLNDMKISLTFMEWYMKKKEEKGGYYDYHKQNPQSREEIERHQVIVTHQISLNQYWKNLVEEKDVMPQKEGAKLRKRWVFGGTNYRRIVEPLDIADHYKKGKTNYLATRPEHYKLLEKWSNEQKKDSNPSEAKRTKASSLTEDSCFWAHVEEALISLKELKGGGSSINGDVVKERLEVFEAYVMGSIRDFMVVPDIFLEESSLMKWWKEYKVYKGASYSSDFTTYMNNKSYESYQ